MSIERGGGQRHGQTPTADAAERPDLLHTFERAIDAHIDTRLAEAVDRLSGVIAARVAATLVSLQCPPDRKDGILLTVPAAAKLLSLSRSTVYELIRRGEIPAMKVGRVRRIPTDALDAFRSAPANVRRAGRAPAEPHTRAAAPVATGDMSWFGEACGQANPHPVADTD